MNPGSGDSRFNILFMLLSEYLVLCYGIEQLACSNVPLE